MATASVLDFPTTTEVDEEAAKRKAEAQKHFSIIKKSWGLVRSNSLRIGFHAWAMERDGLWGILGFANGDEGREAAEVSDSTWYANLSYAKAFDGIAEDDFCAMKQANVKALTDLPLSKRMDPVWIKKAQTDPIEVFALAVDEEMDGKARASDGKERTVSMKISMPKSRKKVVEAGLREYAKTVGVEGDESRAIELMVQEHTGGPSLIGAIADAVQRLKKVKELCESGLSSDEILSQVIQLNEESILEFAAVLEQVQNLESATQ